MGALAAACVALGLAPMVVIPMIDKVTAPFTGAQLVQSVVSENGWALTPMGTEFASISTPVLMLLLTVIIPVVLLSVVLIAGKLKRRSYKTWGCGINLKPRMEYTATGFAQPIRQVFSTIYRPTVKVEKEMLEESRYFAKRMRFEVHIEPTFPRSLYDPVVRMFNMLANRLRVVQAGSLHLYLAYIFLTLLALLLW